MAGLKDFFTNKKQNITTESLKRLNLIAAALHFVQGVAVILISDPDNGIQTVNTSFLGLDKIATESTGSPVLVQGTASFVDVNLAYLVAAFFFMSAIAHLLVATRYRKTYEADLKKGINKFRWYEYAFSASTMILAIAMLSGIFDLGALIALFGLTFVMNLMGLSMETVNQGAKKPNWQSFWIGCIAGILPWVVIALSLVSSSINSDGGVPGFVYGIFVSLFIFFNLFAFNMWLQYKQKGAWANYLFGERVYIILSLVAKSALAWQVFAGTLRP